jgi:hypothetical protein
MPRPASDLGFPIAPRMEFVVPVACGLPSRYPPDSPPARPRASDGKEHRRQAGRHATDDGEDAGRLRAVEGVVGGGAMRCGTCRASGSSPPRAECRDNGITGNPCPLPSKIALTRAANAGRVSCGGRVTGSRRAVVMPSPCRQHPATGARRCDSGPGRRLPSGRTRNARRQKGFTFAAWHGVCRLSSRQARPVLGFFILRKRLGARYERIRKLRMRAVGTSAVSAAHRGPAYKCEWGER